MIIYPDTVFITNFFMTLIVLSITNQIIRLKTRTVNVFLSSMLNSLGATFLLIFCKNEYIWKAASFGNMFLTAFVFVGRGKMREILQIMFAMYVVGTMVNGSLEALFPLGQNELTLGRILLFSLLFNFLIPKLYRMVTGFAITSNNKYLIRIYAEERYVELTALYDTGCKLKNPYNNCPVNVIEKNRIGQVVNLDNELSQLVIPYKSLGNNGALMKMVRVKRMDIRVNKHVKTYENVYFAIYDGKLSQSDEFEAILSCAMLV